MNVMMCNYEVDPILLPIQQKSVQQLSDKTYKFTIFQNCEWKKVYLQQKKSSKEIGQSSMFGKNGKRLGLTSYVYVCMLCSFNCMSRELHKPKKRPCHSTIATDKYSFSKAVARERSFGRDLFFVANFIIFLFKVST